MVAFWDFQPRFGTTRVVLSAAFRSAVLLSMTVNVASEMYYMHCAV